MDFVRDRYERLPYPPIPWLALPSRGVGATVRWPGTEPRPRIWVVGGGTLEPLVVAQANPSAREIVVHELSGNSLKILEKRLKWARISGRPLPPLRLIRGDFRKFAPSEKFDFIVASHVLHHLDQPGAGLENLATHLNEGGLVRFSTYPFASRIWMRRTATYLREQGLTDRTPQLPLRAKGAIEKLPKDSPLRSCFETQPERFHRAGLADAFLHPLENPLPPLLWGWHARRSGLHWMGESQNETSRSSFLEELLPTTAALGPWDRLQILDDLLEVCANPTLWLRKGEVEEIPYPEEMRNFQESLGGSPEEEMRAALNRVQTLLAPVGISLEEALAVLRREVGPRVRSTKGEPAPGLSILDYQL